MIVGFMDRLTRLEEEVPDDSASSASRVKRLNQDPATALRRIQLCYFYF